MNAMKYLALLGLIVGVVSLTSLNFSDEAAQYSGLGFELNWQEERAVEMITAHLAEKNAHIPDEELREVARTMYDAARRYDVDYRLVLAVIDAESNFRHNVVSDAGAVGIMQVKPVVAREFSDEVGIPYRRDVLQCPHANVRFGVYYLSWLSRHYDNEYAVLYAYNVGFTRARQNMQRNSEPKTGYTRKVMEEYERNRSRLPGV
ncbi:MAG TPA: transglycosylase SLT domain-containing protein [Syntrophales bacterium]|nr:transglycosylase SLT domain-containing protein [Syntrophobacterales bacterium]HQL90457.1 transglycosylase SLT domain-containing protein [Syntrophales bacterium]